MSKLGLVSTLRQHSSSPSFPKTAVGPLCVLAPCKDVTTPLPGTALALQRLFLSAVVSWSCSAPSAWHRWWAM